MGRLRQGHPHHPAAARRGGRPGGGVDLAGAALHAADRRRQAGLSDDRPGDVDDPGRDGLPPDAAQHRAERRHAAAVSEPLPAADADPGRSDGGGAGDRCRGRHRADRAGGGGARDGDVQHRRVRGAGRGGRLSGPTCFRGSTMPSRRRGTCRWSRARAAIGSPSRRPPSSLCSRRIAGRRVA